MKSLACDICGGKLIMGKGGMAVCQNCGMEYTPERIKEKMKEGIAEVKIDNSQNVDKWRQLAREAYDNSNYEEAYNLSLKILEVSPDDWEATYLKEFSRGWQSTLTDIRYTAIFGGFYDADGKLQNDPSLSISEKALHRGEMIGDCINWVYALSSLLIEHANEFASEDSDVACLFVDGHGNLIDKTSLLMDYIDESMYIHYPKETQITGLIQDIIECGNSLLSQMTVNYTVHTNDRYDSLADMWFPVYDDFSGNNVYAEEKSLLKVNIKRLSENKAVWSEKRKEYKRRVRKERIAQFLNTYPEERPVYQKMVNKIDDAKKRITEIESEIEQLKSKEEEISERMSIIQKAADSLSNDIYRLQHKWFGKEKALIKASEEQEQLNEVLESLHETHDELTELQNKREEQEQELTSLESIKKHAQDELNKYLRIHKL